MWKDEIILWQDTEHHWNSFGTQSSAPELLSAPLYAKGLVIWKQTTLGELVKKGIESFEVTTEFLSDTNIITGFFLAVTAINLFPFHIKVVKEDEHADAFISLLHTDDEGRQFFIKNELTFHKDIKNLIEYFVKNELLIDENEKLFVKGKVLNRAHIVKK